jgi:hypothetical protein
MTWAPLLLADPSPRLRLLVLHELLGRSHADPEVRELDELQAGDPVAAALLEGQGADGAWEGDRALPLNGRRILGTAQALAGLGYLGFGVAHEPVRRGAEYLFSQQQPDGAWPLPNVREEEQQRTYSLIPLQTAIPLRALVSCGYAADPRVERAYRWLLAQQLADGAWPTGVVAGSYGYVAGYRRLAHSRHGCRSNTTGALACLALHPQLRSSPAAHRALDLMLGRETRETHTLGFEVARLIGSEPARGFLTYYARFDLAQILDLCWRVGATLEDSRVADLVAFVRDLQGPFGLWEYRPRRQATRWVTFDLLRSLARLDHTGSWLSLEPRTPFRAYPRRTKRY